MEEKIKQLEARIDYLEQKRMSKMDLVDGSITPLKMSVTETISEGDLYYSDGDRFIRLPIGTEGQVLKIVSGVPAWAADTDTDTLLQSKIITATRDLSAASGDVAYTGVGFQPAAIVAVSGIGGGGNGNISIADSFAAEANLYSNAGGDSIWSASALYFMVAMVTYPTAFQTAVVKQYDADGFTLTWTKTGLPTGTFTMQFLCFR